MSPEIKVAAVLDNLIVADSLKAWAAKLQDITLVAVTASVGEFLKTDQRECAVVLLDASLRAEPDTALNAKRLLDAGYRVLVIDGSSELEAVARTLAAGAHGYLTRDHGLAALGLTVRAIAFGGSAWSLGPTAATEPDGHPVRPQLSEREHAVLMGYASGQTLEATARELGISLETAKTYLKRIKAKYQLAGLPVYTKLDLAEQVRIDCAAGKCPVGGAKLASPSSPAIHAISRSLALAGNGARPHGQRACVVIWADADPIDQSAAWYATSLVLGHRSEWSDLGHEQAARGQAGTCSFPVQSLSVRAACGARSRSAPWRFG